MPSIPPDLARRLHETLNRCGPFDSDRSLRAVFTDARIHPWRDSVPEAKSLAACVNAIIAALLKKRDIHGNPALALFVEVLAEQVSPADACHQDLVNLAAELRRALREESGTPSPVSAAASSPASKYTIHIHGGQVGVIGDQADIEGGIRFGDAVRVKGTAEAASSNPEAALRMARRALAILEEQAAGYTALTIPTHLKIELEEKRREVAELEARCGDAADQQRGVSQHVETRISADQTIYGGRIVQIAISQMFRIADLLTRPHSVKARAFYDAITVAPKMRRVLNNRTSFNLGNLGSLRPVIQIREKYDRFWTSAIPDLRLVDRDDCPLCFIPYELKLSECFADRRILIQLIEGIGQSIKNLQMDARLRIYSPGTGVIRIGLTLEFEEFIDIKTLSRLSNEIEDLFFVDPESNQKPYHKFFLDVISEVSEEVFIDESYPYEQRCWMPPVTEYSFRGETVLLPEVEIDSLAQLLHLTRGNQESLDDLVKRVQKTIRGPQWQKNRILALPAQGTALFVVDQIGINRSKRKTREILGWLSDTHEIIVAASYAQKTFMEEIDSLYRTQMLDESWLPQGTRNKGNFIYLNSLLRTMLKVIRAIACIPLHLRKQGGSMTSFARNLWLSSNPVDFRSCSGLKYTQPVFRTLETEKSA